MIAKYLIKLGIIFALICGVNAQGQNNVGNPLANSELITFNGNTTLVPKNALLQIPEKYSTRINNHKPGSEILSWKDFYAINREWITTVEVTLVQARAETPISPEVLETLSKNENLVVAVYKDSPVFIRPAKDAAEVKN